MTQPLPRRVRAGYGLGSVATGSFGAVPGLLLLPYLTDHLGVAAGVAGLLVAIPKIWDVFFNPLVGKMSDAAGAGSRRQILFVGGLTLAVLFALIFLGPTSGLAGAAWVVGTYLACASAYAFFQVPYMALPAELTSSPTERTRLMTWRVAVLALAILVSGGAAPLIRDALGYPMVGVFVGLLIAAGVTGAWCGTRGAALNEVQGASGTLREQLAVVISHRAFRMLLATWVIQALATGAMLAGVDYVAREVLHNSGVASILFVCFVGPALLVTPLWQRFSQHRDKATGYLAASILLALGMVGTWAALYVGTVAAALALAVVGVGYAGIQLFPMSLLPDVAAADAAENGVNRAGLFTGVWTAGETLGLALGPFLFAGVIALGGYVSPPAGGFVWQPHSAVVAIHWGFTLVPAALILVSLTSLKRTAALMTS